MTAIYFAMLCGNGIVAFYSLKRFGESQGTVWLLSVVLNWLAVFGWLIVIFTSKLTNTCV